MKHTPFRSLVSLVAALALGALASGTGSAYGAWQLVWSDEFDGTDVNPTKWTYDIGNGSGGWGNNELEYYTNRPQNVYVTNGLLHIVARKEVPQYNGFDYTSAKLKTQGLFSKKYGRFEFRARLPQGQGYWPALWMMPQDSVYGGWARSGEIDVMENKGSTPTTTGGTIHYGGSWPNNVYSGTSYIFPGGGVATDFHNYMLEWGTNYMKWYVDGVLYQTQTSWYSSGNPYPAPFDQPFYLIMNLAVGGNYGGNPDGTTVFPGEMQVDYVRVYDYVPAVVPPDAPTGLTVSPGNAKVYLSWDASTSGATGYNVKRSTVSGSSYTTIASPTANSYTDTTASSCSTYYYVVSATNSFGESTNSSEKAAALGAFALAVNSGGSAAGQFIADAYFSGGTQAAPTANTIDTSAVTTPAPQAVYQSERYGNCTYTFPGLTSGLNYKVRLHFAEFYWTAVGQRRFNVSINGTQVLANFDIIAAAGAANKANIQEFTATPSSGQITVQYTTVTDNAKASGIELLIQQPAAPTGLTANAGNSQVALNWNPLAGASYNLKRALASGGPYNSVSNGLTSTNYTDAGLTNGTIYYYVVSAAIAGCESTNSTPVSATPACSPPPAPTAGNNGPICAGSTLSLTAWTVSGAAYSWTGPNGFTSSAQNPSIPNATTSASGIYSVTVTLNGCTSAAGATTATVNATPAAPTAGNNGPINAGATLNLTASTVPGATYNWTGPNGFTSTDQNPSIVSATTNSSGLYSVTATTGACTSVPGTTTATINPPARVTIQFLAGEVILSWPGGTLQSATNVSGLWGDVSGATSPRTNPAAAPQEFYRLRLQ